MSTIDYLSVAGLLLIYQTLCVFMETVLIKTAQVLLSLSILVFVHELGHFGFARLFKVRVNKFYLFFNPKFSIMRMKKINGHWQVKFFAPNLDPHVMQAVDDNGSPMVDKKGKPLMVPAPVDDLPADDWRRYPESTEWGIGWVPLGGYCAIDGMIDESMDPTLINTEPKPWEYRAQKAWKRMFIITGGVLMNFVAAIIIYAMMLFTWGQDFLPVSNAYLGYDYCPTALSAGFANGDRILTIDGESIATERDVMEKLVIDGKQHVVVQRGDNNVDITLPHDFGEQMLEAGEKELMRLRFPFVVGLVVDGSPAQQVGLMSGDSVVAVNGKKTLAYSDVVGALNEVAKSDSSLSEPVTLEFLRNGNPMSVNVAPEDGKLGVRVADPMKFFKTEHREYGFFASIPAGINLGWETLVNYVKQFRLVFTKAGAKSVGGFIAIGNIFPSQWNWVVFWSMTALLSVMLAFMNILPIPVLDGGYFLMLIYEMITGRKPSDRFMEVAMNVGMFILLALLIFANGNDIIKLFTR